MDYLLIAVLVLGSIAFVASLVLYVCSRKFYVKEDSRVGSVTELLPHANCGGCGYPGCSGLLLRLSVRLIPDPLKGSSVL